MQHLRHYEAAPSKARTATFTSESLVNRGCGAVIGIDVTAVTDTPNVSQLELQALVGGSWKTFAKWDTLTINAAGQYQFLACPGATASAEWTAPPIPTVVPLNFRVKLTHDDADSITYSVTVTEVQG